MPPDATLEVKFTHRLGTLALDVEFATKAAWCLLFGSSGSGKSTILRAIAGMLRPDAGRIVIGGRVVFDSDAGVWVPPHERPMRWAAQRAMLYEWKTVRENLAMGGAPVEQVIERFGMSALAGLRSEKLSGGQRQRVGVVRAAARVEGRLLLLDEPFTGLDAAIRARLIEDLREWIGDSPVLSVTHNVEEAFLLGAEIIRIADGRVTAQGQAAEILGEERTRILRTLSKT